MNFSNANKKINNLINSYPTKYPLKRYYEEDELFQTMKDLEESINSLGLENFNIGIKNILATSLSSFLIVYKKISNKKEIRIYREDLSNGIRISMIIDSINESLDISYCNNGDIIWENNFGLELKTIGSKYDYTTMLLNMYNPNMIVIKSEVKKKRCRPTNQVKMVFNNEGIEMKRNFEIKPYDLFGIFKDIKLIGTITRGEVYHLATMELEDNGINKNTTFPIVELNGFNNDINLLNLSTSSIYEHSRMGGTENISKVINTEYSNEDFNQGIDLLSNAQCLESSNRVYLNVRIHTPYSNDILENVKKEVKQLNRK